MLVKSNLNKTKIRRILGVDPGTATVGYGIIDCASRNVFDCVASGTIQTSKTMVMGDRLNIIRNDLMSLIKEYSPCILSIESIFFFKNAKTLVPVAQARGVILEAASALAVPVVEYTPMQVKQNLTGFGRADKKMIQIAVAQILRHESIIKPDDAADALAIAICHARSAAAQILSKVAEPSDSIVSTRYP